MANLSAAAEVMLDLHLRKYRSNDRLQRDFLYGLIIDLDRAFPAAEGELRARYGNRRRPDAASPQMQERNP